MKMFSSVKLTPKSDVALNNVPQAKVLYIVFCCFHATIQCLWLKKVLETNCIYDGVRPRQGNLKDLNNLKTSLRFPCLGLNPIIDYFSHPIFFKKLKVSRCKNFCSKPLL